MNAFLNNTQSQLTYHGLFTLASILEPGSLVALFRNSHLSVLYKSEDEDASLYTLVSDHAFLQEPSVVWECLEDVDGGWATFVDSDFVRSSPIGGDFAGQTAEATLRAMEAQAHAQAGNIDPAEYVYFFLPSQLVDCILRYDLCIPLAKLWHSSCKPKRTKLLAGSTPGGNVIGRKRGGDKRPQQQQQLRWSSTPITVTSSVRILRTEC